MGSPSGSPRLCYRPWARTWLSQVTDSAHCHSLPLPVLHYVHFTVSHACCLSDVVCSFTFTVTWTLPRKLDSVEDQIDSCTPVSTADMPACQAHTLSRTRTHQAVKNHALTLESPTHYQHFPIAPTYMRAWALALIGSYPPLMCVICVLISVSGEITSRGQVGCNATSRVPGKANMSLESAGECSPAPSHHPQHARTAWISLDHAHALCTDGMSFSTLPSIESHPMRLPICN